MASKRPNVTFDFARWLWGFLHEGPVDYESSNFKKYLGQAARLRKEGYDLRLVRGTLEAMRQRGITVNSPYAVKWQSPDRNNSWYDFASPGIPALWDGLALHLHENEGVPARIS